MRDRIFIVISILKVTTDIQVYVGAFECQIPDEDGLIRQASRRKSLKKIWELIHDNRITSYNVCYTKLLRVSEVTEAVTDAVSAVTAEEVSSE